MKGTKSELPSYYYLQPSENGEGEDEEELYDSNGTHITSEHLNDVVAKSMPDRYIVLHDSSDNPVYRCKECDRILRSTGHLVGHILGHTGENPFVCRLCQRSFANSTRLKLHLRVHCIKKPRPGLTVTRITKSPPTATVVSSTSDNVGALQSKPSEEDRTFRCIECELIFPKDELYRHMKQHLMEKNLFEQKTYSCDRCNEEFDKLASLQQHMEECRGYIKVSSEVELVPIRKNDANGGKKQIEDNPILSELLMRETNEPPLVGAPTLVLDSPEEDDEEDPAESFEQKYNPHLITGVVPSTNKVQAGFGGAGFIISSVATVDQQFLESLAQMELQTRSSGLKDLPLEDRTTDTSNTNLPVQKQISLTVCSLCGKAFNEPFGLRQHMRIMHAETKPFKCPECKKHFAQERSMYIHLRVHISQRPFICIVCYKTFTRSTALNGHMSCHAHDSIKCIECGEVIVNIHNYSNHVEAKHPNFSEVLDQIRTDKPNHERSKILRRILTQSIVSNSGNEQIDEDHTNNEPTFVDYD